MTIELIRNAGVEGVKATLIGKDSEGKPITLVSVGPTLDDVVTVLFRRALLRGVGSTPEARR